MNKENSYQYFSEGDFFSDPEFQDWVINPNPENELFWEQFFKSNPGKQQAGETARKMLLNLRFEEHVPDAGLIENSLAKHLADIERLDGSKVININPRYSFKVLFRIAAVFIGVMVIVAALLLFTKDELIIVEAAYGKIRSVVLPDSSVVVLNGNSNIRYSKEWNKRERREVWLEGEAFFDIRHLNRDTSKIEGADQFVVHTAALRVEVLGTSFDVRQRREKTEIVLQTGSIQVSLANRKSTPARMKPGEKILYLADEDKLVRSTTDPVNFSAWRQKRLLLEDPTAAEVIEYLEDVFGKKFVLQDPILAKRTIEGPIMITTLDDALFVLSTVLNAEIVKTDSTIRITPR